MELILLFEIFLQNTTNQITNMTEFFQSTHFKSTPSPDSTNLPIFKQILPIPWIQPFLGKLANLFYKKYGSELWRLDTLSLVSHTTKRAIIIQSFYVSQKQRVFWNIFCFTFTSLHFCIATKKLSWKFPKKTKRNLSLSSPLENWR